MAHENTVDYMCPRCKMMIQSHIVHECDPSICVECNGRGYMGWRGKDSCHRCNGTGKTIFTDDPPEDNPIAVEV